MTEVFKEFEHNPMGKVIALLMFFMLLYFLSSLSGFSPINNSTISNQLGCNTCGPGGTAGGAYTFIKPFGVILMASLPIILIVGYLADDKRKRSTLPSDGTEEEE